MVRRLRAHQAYVAGCVADLQAAARHGEPVADRARDLSAYHARETRNFQHERLVHLLVTLFFGVILVGCFAAIIVLAGVPAEVAPSVAGVFVLTMVVLVLEMFYAGHYYRLENAVQRLYTLDREIAHLIGLPDPGSDPPPSAAPGARER
jgi:Flp pilus assembly protein TadB